MSVARAPAVEDDRLASEEIFVGYRSQKFESFVVEKLEEHDQQFAAIWLKLGSHDVRFDEHSAKHDSHSAKLDEHSAKHDSHSAKLDEHSAKLDAHSAKLDEHSMKLDHIDRKVDNMAVELHKLGVFMEEYDRKQSIILEAIMALHENYTVVKSHNKRLDIIEYRLEAVETKVRNEL